MRNKILKIFILGLFSFYASQVLAAIPTAERDALIALYNNTNGDNWSDNKGWVLAKCNQSSWDGITCNADQSHVIRINLSNNNLSGTIPDLSALTALQYINLSDNNLTGVIPNLSHLTALTGLDLSRNQLTGAIPSLNHLTDLTSIDLERNKLTGVIPELDNLIQLRELNLNDNQLTGSIPRLNTLTSLSVLDLSHNQLTGSIPDISTLSLLQFFSLYHNQLTGLIPDLSDLTTRFTIFDLGFNQLTGSIPNLSHLTALRWLQLNHNQLTGAIPDLSLLTGLKAILLDYNQLSGVVDHDVKIKEGRGLRAIHIDHNQCLTPIDQAVKDYIISKKTVDYPDPWLTQACNTEPLPLLSDTEKSEVIFNWAERIFHDLFPAHLNSFNLNIDGFEPFLVRGPYPKTANYMGVSGKKVYIYGDAWGGLAEVGDLDTLYNKVR